jgi:hypothetical protein
LFVYPRNESITCLFFIRPTVHHHHVKDVLSKAKARENVSVLFPMREREQKFGVRPVNISKKFK